MARGGDGGGLGSVITWGIVAAGGYLIYRWWSSTVPVPTGAPPGAPPTPTAAANASTPTISAPNVSALDAIYASMSAAAAKGGYSGASLLNADQWGYYLAQGSGTPAPDPTQLVISGTPLNRSTNWPTITSAQYWAAVAPLVAQQHGLQGIGALAGLGRYVASRRRRR